MATDSHLLIFDWGGTIMVDYMLPGPMYLWEQVAWVEGAEDSLRNLTQRFPLVIATNAPHSGSEEMVKALDRIDAAPFFQRYYSSRDLGVGKPDPRFFLAIAEKEGMDPGACIMIGNHYVNDIEGASTAGMHTIFYNEKGLTGKHEKADQVIYHMQDLVQAVDRIVHEEK